MEEYHAICELATAWFELQLHGAEAVWTFLKERNIDAGIVHDWRLGYCPEGKENELLAMVESAGFSAGLAVKTGLLFHDRNRLRLACAFAGRLIIPKCNAAGRISGFGARLIVPRTPFIPKYIQSAETPVYSMYSLLFGMDRASDAILQKRFAILTEGYFDVIRLHELGIRNSVALIGTRIGKGQVEALQKSTQRILLLFDGDKPGRDGAEVSKVSLERDNAEVHILYLPEGMDPDSMLISPIANALERRLSGSWESIVSSVGL